MTTTTTPDVCTAEYWATVMERATPNVALGMARAAEVAGHPNTPQGWADQHARLQTQVPRMRAWLNAATFTGGAPFGGDKAAKKGLTREGWRARGTHPHRAATV